MKSINKNFKKSNIFDIKSKYIIMQIFNHLNATTWLSMVKYNKIIKNKLDITINDLLNIEIELYPKENIYDEFININKNNKYFHIYFNNDKKEIKRNILTKEDNVNKIRIIINKEVDSFEKLFDNCKCIKKISFIKSFRNNITNMRYMFKNCKSLEELNFLNFNTKNVKYMGGMFYNCSSLKEIDLSNFNTENVIDMSFMFKYCFSLKELDLSNFSGKQLKYISSMFSNCTSLKKLNLSNFYIDKPIATDYMFSKCRSLETILKI